MIRTLAATTVTALALVVAGALAPPAPTPLDEASARPPATPDGPIAPEARAHIDGILYDVGHLALGSVDALGRSGDARLAWFLLDLMQLHTFGDAQAHLQRAVERLTGVAVPEGRVEPVWVSYTDLLLRWDLPAPPDYATLKRRFLLELDTRWGAFLQADAEIDWREVAWGGVFRDAIEALVEPPVVDAAAGDAWLEPEDIVFAVSVAGQHRAYPERVLEVHELVNDTLGERGIAVPYCTLCGTAVLYFTDDVAGVNGSLEFRTSGLLRRSNKLMYDAATETLWDQFTGTPVAGTLQRAGAAPLSRGTLIVTTWRQWRSSHPDTSVLAEDAGTGRTYDGAFLTDRPAEPIFPTGPRDGRLQASTPVIGVVTPRGSAVAFDVAAARAALQAGEQVRLGGVRLLMQSGGLVPALIDGPALVGQEARWFAWSQFHPGTLLWPNGRDGAA